VPHKQCNELNYPFVFGGDMPFNIESHLLILLNHLLSQEKNHFFEEFEIDSETQLVEVLPDPNVQHIWKSAHIVRRAYESGYISIKKN
jgi:hypothetical protein